jgi:Reverse transcriptase (RNA-dependent DNA polymerase)
MLHGVIPQSYWPDIFKSVTLVINHLPSSALSFDTPYHVLFNRKPDYTFFKVLDCACYPYTRPYMPHKLAPRSSPCVFIGYSTLYKGYKYLNLQTNKTFISRQVNFDESSFPFKNFAVSSTLPSSLPIFTSPLVVLQPPSSTLSIPTPSLSSTLPILSTPSHTPCRVYERRKPVLSTPSAPSDVSVPTHPMQTRSKTRMVTSLPKALLATKHPINHIHIDPTIYNQASKHPHWRAAMAAELDALANNNTWTLVPVFEVSNVVGSKWVFKTKYRADDTVERYKARLVEKGYTQEEGLDYTETFSLVIKPTTIRLILSLAVTHH